MIHTSTLFEEKPIKPMNCGFKATSYNRHLTTVQQSFKLRTGALAGTSFNRHFPISFLQKSRISEVRPHFGKGLKMVFVIDLTGKRVGFLTVLYRTESQKHSNRSRWICRCDCGKEINTLGDMLRIGTKTHCGCKKMEIGHYHRKDYEIKAPEYSVWVQMKHRCHYHPRYKDVSVCERWENSYEFFLADMGKRPSNKYSIDRIDPFGNYEPSNCRWATIDVQANNKRRNKPQKPIEDVKRTVITNQPQPRKKYLLDW